MATYEQLFVLRQDGKLLGRFVVAVEIAATQIVHEDGAQPKAAERMTWAKRAILAESQSQRYASTILKLAVAENSVLQEQGADVTDNDIQFIVNSYLTRLVDAGV